jgi:wyosine [tRNA(Phe)-imidazoG37] synthetase (radical SAM superfamily)
MGADGLRSCARGALLPPLFCTKEEIVAGEITRELIVERRKHSIAMLNDNDSEMDCKRCLMVVKKRYGDICFSHLGHIDLQHYTKCNLRCSYCVYARNNSQLPPQYDALAVLRQFSPDDIEWNAHVDFAGGEPALLDNLAEFLEFFRSRRIRVLMHTNGVKFHQSIYDGLEDGSLYWVTVSLDAGRPSTYRDLRGSDKFLQVMENLSRYAVAGSKGKGMLSVKYIFCESNCSEDDIAGFAYAMLALRPQKVWLTFDFTPLYLRQEKYDFAVQIEAYARLYLLLKKHGIEPFHYFREAVASVSQDGKNLMSLVLVEIERQRNLTSLDDPDLHYRDFRKDETAVFSQPTKFIVNPLRILKSDGTVEPLDLAGKRVLIVPACLQTITLLADVRMHHAVWTGFVDRNPIQQGKEIQNSKVFGYEDINALCPDIILIAAPEKHREDIVEAVCRQSEPGIEIYELADHTL